MLLVPQMLSERGLGAAPNAHWQRCADSQSKMARKSRRAILMR
jgi:hypothetical protein